VYHDATHQEKKAYHGALPMVKETLNAEGPAAPGDGRIGRLQEKIHADTEEDRIDDAGDHDPLPQPMFADELMRFDIRLEGYDNFFEQSAFLFILSG
jgi:hypothetical protein